VDNYSLLELCLIELSSPNPWTRIQALMSCAKYNFTNPSIGQKVTELIQDKNEKVVYTAIYAAGELKVIGATNALIECCKNKDISLRLSSACALNRLIGVESLLYLEDMLKDRDPWVAYSVAKIILTHDDQNEEAKQTMRQYYNHPKVVMHRETEE